MKQTLREKIDKISGYLYSISKYFVLIFILLFLVFLTLESLLRTSDININNSAWERIDYLQDIFPLNLLILALSLLLLYLLWQKLARASVRSVLYCCTVWVLAFGVFWVISAQMRPGADSRYITEAALGIINGDVPDLALQDFPDYFNVYPYQLGFMLYCEGVIRLFHLKDSLVLLSVLNVIYVAAAYVAATLLVGRLFESKEAQKLTAILLALFLPPIFFSSLIYGNIPGYMLSIYAVLFAVSYIQTGKLRYAFLLLPFIGLAVMMKLNFLISAVAIAIILLLHAIRHRKWFDFLLPALTIASAVLFWKFPIYLYSWRCGVDFGGGLPMISWVAMGISPDPPITAGWYNGSYTLGSFRRVGYDQEAQSAVSIEFIRERMTYFKENFSEARTFFYEKTVSQWNEPSFQSLWLPLVRGTYQEPGFFYYACVSDAGQAILKYLMGIYQQLVLPLSCVGIIKMLRQNKPEQLILPVIVIGGFLYHLLFEAKSQYILTYFILLVPIAAYGAVFVFDKMRQLFDQFRAYRTGQTTLDKPDAAEDGADHA